MSCSRCSTDENTSLCGADVLTPRHGELETVWPFGGEAQLVGCALEQRDCPLEWEAGTRTLCARRHETCPKRLRLFMKLVMKLI